MNGICILAGYYNHVFMSRVQAESIEYRGMGNVNPLELPERYTNSPSQTDIRQ